MGNPGVEHFSGSCNLCASKNTSTLVNFVSHTLVVLCGLASRDRVAWTGVLAKGCCLRVLSFPLLFPPLESLWAPAGGDSPPVRDRHDCVFIQHLWGTQKYRAFKHSLWFCRGRGWTKWEGGATPSGVLVNSPVAGPSDRACGHRHLHADEISALSSALPLGLFGVSLALEVVNSLEPSTLRVEVKVCHTASHTKQCVSWLQLAVVCEDGGAHLRALRLSIHSEEQPDDAPAVAQWREAVCM
jgi:hypothetical protein